MRLPSYAKKNWIKFVVGLGFLAYVLYSNRLSIKHMYVTYKHVIGNGVADTIKPTAPHNTAWNTGLHFQKKTDGFKLFENVSRILSYVLGSKVEDFKFGPDNNRVSTKVTYKHVIGNGVADIMTPTAPQNTAWNNGLHFQKKTDGFKLFENVSRILSYVLGSKVEDFKFGPDNNRVSTKGFLTIGIPTVQRKGVVYIYSTLESLLNNSRPKTKHAWEIKIVILLADTNTTYNDELAKNITNVYQDLIDEKVIHLVTIPRNYYPDFNYLKLTYNDPVLRVKWRSKQNLDYAYLMTYSANLCHYYLQLEDDLLTRAGYLDKIKGFIYEHTTRDWAMLDFSRSGFIGKLYHSRDIVKLANLLKTFFNEKPCDWLMLDFLALMLQRERYFHEPKLFRHLGLHSSLAINKRVTDPDF